MREGLYGDAILQWSERSEHIGTVENPDGEATATNPLCGDRVTVQVRMEGDAIKELYYQVRGCLLCRASCVLFADLAEGLELRKLKSLRDRFEQFLRCRDNTMVLPTHEIFSPARSCRSRHRCLLLPYDVAVEIFPVVGKS